MRQETFRAVLLSVVQESPTGKNYEIVVYHSYVQSADLQGITYSRDNDRELVTSKRTCVLLRLNFRDKDRETPTPRALVGCLSYALLLSK